ncbi:glycoside hydrolase family 95 protein-like protein [Microthyrium microscopicum]|uniref:Glycoside hydrolase family 95 protein-like protein n=1 Tax=Microthyrium microscopicum TaxID=703497 RepID=A0A6A6U2E0_9PEZI|nr:glycoside hydrolase family 95 protein-like protein [Microthyrium microscopicum]
MARSSAQSTLPTALVLAVFALLFSIIEAKALWSLSPASSGRFIRESFPVGNGRLGALPFGQPGQEKLNLNLDSLWSGGPFESAKYNGGNPSEVAAASLAGIRDNIFRDGTGSLAGILGSNNNYGSYRVLANLSVVIQGITRYAHYNRSLDLSTGVHSTTFVGNDNNNYTSAAYCSYPAKACIYRLSSTGALPNIAVALENRLVQPSLYNATCDNSMVRLAGVTQHGDSTKPQGMEYDVIARLSTGALGMPMSSCSKNSKGTIVVTGSAYGGDSKLNTFSVIVGAASDYDPTQGTAESKFSFRGPKPGTALAKLTAQSSVKLETKLLTAHQQDYARLMSGFELDLYDPWKTSEYPSETLQFEADPSVAQGDPYVEGLLFDYARHLFISSSRDDSLPPNLQGRWADGLESAWSGDYHANINLQMNHWFADQVGLGHLQEALFKYIVNTWVPRGTETAHLLYNSPGWVVHDEINIFGHTGMKNTAEWANYPAAAAWMMQTIFDHWDYTRDLGWLQTTGYNLLRQVSQFWMAQLQQDRYTKDNTLVVNPCNSPEKGPTTFGCAHYQQVIHQLFTTTLAAANAVNDVDTEFTGKLTQLLTMLDKGLAYTSWGGIREFKLPESMGHDTLGDKHRHLSHLVGWYPGYSIASFQDGYANSSIQAAVAASLRSRGNGKADGNTGWAKVWRAAAWARLNDTEQADYHLRYAIYQNIGQNGLSIYDGANGPFQIDANFGLAGAMLAMLVYDVPAKLESTEMRQVVLGPAIPSRWGPGKVKGLRLRGGTVLDMEWNNRGVVGRVAVQKRGEPVAFYSKENKLIGRLT